MSDICKEHEEGIAKCSNDLDDTVKDIDIDIDKIESTDYYKLQILKTIADNLNQQNRLMLTTAKLLSRIADNLEVSR